MNGVIEIFVGMGKSFRVCRYAFLFIWKLQVIPVRRKCLLYTSFIIIYGSFGNEVFKVYVYRPSMTVTLLCSQGFCLCYRVTLDLTRVSLSTKLSVTHAEIRKTTSALQCFFFIFQTQLQRFFCGISNPVVKPVCFVSI